MTLLHKNSHNRIMFSMHYFLAIFSVIHSLSKLRKTLPLIGDQLEVS